MTVRLRGGGSRETRAERRAHVGTPGGGGRQQDKREAIGDARPGDTWVLDFWPLIRKKNKFPFSLPPSLLFWYSTAGNTGDNDGKAFPGVLFELQSGH